MRIEVYREEAKGSRVLLRLLRTGGKKELGAIRAELIQEATEPMSIFGSIVCKSECDR